MMCRGGLRTARIWPLPRLDGLLLACTPTVDEFYVLLLWLQPQRKAAPILEESKPHSQDSPARCIFCKIIKGRGVLVQTNAC